MKLILASKSPRRIEMLKNLGLSPEIIPADVDENIEEFKGQPRLAVTTLASRKAMAVNTLAADKNAVIIAADTLVYKGNTLLGKPKDKDEAFTMLKSLSGTDHSVYTGIAVCHGGKLKVDSVETKVYFRELSESEINTYIQSEEPLDKAGAYGIQGRGALFVKGIEGDYFNVVGLPLCALFELLEKEFEIRPEHIKSN